ncbi:hypothetical protein Tco_0813830, partial [Tanacetum coccineum]
KFLMYPRFVQVFVNQQLDGLPSHKRIYVTPSHTKKIFGNMKMVGNGFSGKVTPLFPTMVVHNQEEIGDEWHLIRAATTASSLEAEQDSGGGPRTQKTMGDTIAQTRFENVSKHSNDPLLARGLMWNTLTGDEVLSRIRKYCYLKNVNLTIDEVTLASAHSALKS